MQKPHFSSTPELDHAEVIDFADERRERALRNVLDRTGLRPDDVIVCIDEDEPVVDLAARPASQVEVIEQDNSIAEQGFCKKAPLFSEQIQDATRKMSFSYRKHDGTYATMTERDGLVNLWDSLNDFLDLTDPPKQMGNFTLQVVENLRLEARSILDSLTFIGHSEYEEATRGIGEYWRAFLDEDPSNQLCIVAGATDHVRQEYGEHERKSDDWLREDILLGFTDEELAHYSGRIHGKPQDITADPAHTKIVLLDDWCISGDTLRKVYARLANEDSAHEFIQADCVEANLIVVSNERLENGLRTQGGPLQKNTIPVIGFYKSHEASCPEAQENHAHVSGLHSHVNYGFRDSIRPMLKLKDMITNTGKQHKKSIAPLMHIESTYDDKRIQPVISITDKVERIGYADATQRSMHE